MRLFFAINSNSNLDLLQKYNVRNILVSFYYLKSKLLQKILDCNANLFLDSGAHTFHNKKGKVDYDLFFENYLQFLHKYKSKFPYFVELDIENKVGLKKVEEWRRILQQEIDDPIVVWHRNRGWDYWVDMCKKYDYIGFSGFVERAPEVPLKYIPRFLEEAKKHKTKVHGFGFTRLSFLNTLINKNILFYSVDSSSFTAGSRYGNIFFFDRNRLIQLLSNKRPLRNSNHYISVNEWNIIQWKKYSDYLEKIGEHYENRENKHRQYRGESLES